MSQNSLLLFPGMLLEGSPSHFQDKTKGGREFGISSRNYRLIQWSKIYNPQYIVCHAQNIPSALLSKAGSIQNMGDFKNIICGLPWCRSG